MPHQGREACLSIAGEWAGPATICFADICPLCDDGDVDRDGDVDLYDFAWFQACFGSPGSGDCRCVDMDNDNDVDLDGFEDFLDALNGP